MSHGDFGIWKIGLKNELRKRGINEFILRDLPKELQIRGMTKKAKGLGIIKRVKKVVGYSIWRLEEHDRIK